MDDPNRLQMTLQDLESLLQRTLRDQLRVQELLDQLETTLPELTETATRLSTTTQSLASLIDGLRQLSPVVTALLASLKTAGQPHRLRGTILAITLVVVTTLATLFAISAVYPGWTLRATQRHQLEIGELILDNFHHLSVQDQQRLKDLLTRLTHLPQPSSATSKP